MAGAPMPAGSLGVACPDTPGVTAAEVGSAKTQLEKEEQSLLRMKELFEQQLKVLQVRYGFMIYYRRPTCYISFLLSFRLKL